MFIIAYLKPNKSFHLEFKIYMQRSKFGSEIIGFDLANVLCGLSANKLFVWI